jgi:hypothetical protein
MLIRTHFVSCASKTDLIWKSPIYRFVVEDEFDQSEEQSYKEIYIDVTDSAPSFDEPKEHMRNVFDKVLKLLPKHPSILDFGAGKLRNTIHFLKEGCNVAAVEFKELGEKTDHAKKMYKQAYEYDTFEELVFPHRFFGSKKQFDLILLINVCSIMPVPSERLLVLQYCREKLKDEGLVLWYSQHKDHDYIKRCTEDVKLGDGYYINKNKRFQTFYRDFEPHEIDAMFLANGFRYHDKYPVSHNIARLYRKVGQNPIANVLNQAEIRKYVTGDKDFGSPTSIGPRIMKQDVILNIPIPEELRDEAIYINALKRLSPGTNYATKYHNLITAIAIKLFIPPLENPKIEYEVNGNDERIDLVMNNHASSGFFTDIVEKHRIHAPYIIIECKNHGKKVGNPSLAQIADRFSSSRGHFGLLIYRHSADEKNLFEKCINRRKDKGDYIIPLSDDDLIEMLTLKIQDENVDELLNDKLQSLDFGNPT